MAWETKEDQRKRAALRYRNARFLMLERCQGKVARFARILKSSHSYAAAYVGDNPSKRIGDKVACKIELAFAMPPKWLDEDRSATWDKRLKAATGPTVHPLDATEVADEWQTANPDKLMAELAQLPENLTEAVMLGDVIQHRYASVCSEMLKLEQMQHALAERSANLYFNHFEEYLLGAGFVVKPPRENGAPVFRIWHPDPAYPQCLEIRLAIRFSPVLAFRPLPPAVKELVAIPYVTQQDNQHRVHYFYFALDERITAFDISQIVYQSPDFQLLTPAGQLRMRLNPRQDLTQFFQPSEPAQIPE